MPQLPPSLALALLATLGSAIAVADPLTCHGWLNANDSAVDNPYNATLIQLMPAVITRLIPELVRECLEQATLGFASAVKRALLALDAPKPQVQEVAPEPRASEVVATEPPDLEAVAPEPPAPPPHPSRQRHQSSHKSRKPSQGHGHQTRPGSVHATRPGG